MYFSRIILGVASLSVLSMFLALKTNSADMAPKYATITVPCTYNIDVDPNQGVTQIDAYICDGKKVTWNANGYDFHVVFKKKCPFTEGCRQINNGHPSGTVISHTTLTVYDYGIRVNDAFFDPHVVGGGGNSAYSDKAPK